MKLEGKIAIVTGASRGIGRAIAKAFAAEGACLSIISRSEKIFKTAAEIKSPALPIQGDISSQGAVNELVDRTVEEFGGVDILVNNAGVQGPIGFLVENDPDEWIKTIHINLYSVFLCCRAVIPIMKESGGGKIINLSGGGSTSPRPCFTAYSASKTAVVRLSETLAEEVKPFNIQVNAMAPGAVNTRMLYETLAAGSKAGDNARREAQRQLIEGGVSFSEPTALAVFLASNDSADLTGKLISAVGDDWKNLFPKNIARLNQSEMYTLRRVTRRDGFGDRTLNVQI